MKFVILVDGVDDELGVMSLLSCQIRPTQPPGGWCASCPCSVPHDAPQLSLAVFAVAAAVPGGFCRTPVMVSSCCDG
jgi:hypothetical protein